MVALERINVRETVGRKNKCMLNFFSMYFTQNNEEIHLSFKNSEKYRTQALNVGKQKPLFLLLIALFGFLCVLVMAEVIIHH